jgi:3-methyladenine DNA glycosylase AlkC
MGEPLKNHYGPDIPRRIGEMIATAWPAFDKKRFVADALDGYEPLELKQRAQHIAKAMSAHLPKDFPTAVEILLASLGPVLAETESFGMAPFLYFPHIIFVAEHGLDHFEESMRAQHALTQRFSAEFSIRSFLEKHPTPTLARLREWTTDESPHVRRLVSEGTRPRLPWAPRLRDFMRDPAPVLSLLELLKDDPQLYVRRSVANNLNDIGKDHPEILTAVAKQWLRDATPERQWVVRHALRSAVKRGEVGALDAMGYGGKAKVEIGNVAISPKRAVMGGAVTIAFDVANTRRQPQHVLVDFRIHFVKSNGKSSPKVFKLKELDLAPRETVSLSKKVSLKEMTTRKHYPGRHVVDVVINGHVRPLGMFELCRAKGGSRVKGE